MDTYQSNEPKTRQEKKNSRKNKSTHGKYNSKHIRKYLYLLEKKTPGFKDTGGYIGTSSGTLVPLHS
jgi:hypothetical protein